MLSGTIPKQLVALTSTLTGELRLGINSLSGSLPGFVGRLTKLSALSLHENLLSGTLPSGLGGLTSLADLELGDNRISGSVPSQLAGLTSSLRSLADLSFHGNLLSGRLPTSMADAACRQKCAMYDWQCCNDNWNVAEDQYHSCLQGCMMVTAGFQCVDDA